MKDPEIKLLPECEGKYKVVNTHLPTLYSPIGFIDFRTMTVEQAEALLKTETSYLIRVKKATA
ncbi:hypothetical protein DBR40_24755 [Pedobacter sp. KBW01]|uniref:hypothetical protein n=1 Tax=Pedobacter sp. KBW01 TaxID=2153364 RepID=UPI000F595FA5|nr:hypothetical protein [Pedobacter sp. KBW01]RQO65085.1 hypothetical protein DBR40_24755 [Pedobacter sp. KBW01]